jgi:ABC-type lipoprotein release transport system permease subunit
LTYVFSVSGVLVWLIVVIVLSTTACLLPARYALLLSVRETLTYE